MNTIIIWNIASWVIVILLVIIGSLIATACYSLFNSLTHSSEVIQQTSWSTVLRNQNRIVRAKRYQPTRNLSKMSRRKSIQTIEDLNT